MTFFESMLTVLSFFVSPGAIMILLIALVLVSLFLTAAENLWWTVAVAVFLFLTASFSVFVTENNIPPGSWEPTPVVVDNDNTER